MGTLTNYSIAGGVPVDVFPVKDKTGAAVAGRTVRAYREDTGELIGSAATTDELSEQVGDEHWASVVLAMHMDGANNSTTFTDETGKTVTRYGDAKISTVQSKFGGASGYFDGTGDYLGFSTSSDLSDIHNVTFTIEAWVYPQNPGSNQSVITIGGYLSNGLGLWIDSSKVLALTFAGGGATVLLQGGLPVQANTWQHIALVKDGTTWTLYLNGVYDNSIVNTTTKTITASSWIGYSNYSGGYYYSGYIDDLRITKGVARYTANFTPPAAAFLGAHLPPTPLGGYKIDTGAHTGPCTLVFSGEPDRNALVLSGVTPV